MTDDEYLAEMVEKSPWLADLIHTIKKDGFMHGWLSVPQLEPKYPDGFDVVNALIILWPALKDHRVLCPARTIVEDNKCFTEQRLFRIIIHLNDYHGWSREQIADWLETLDVDLKLKEQS